MYIENPQLDRGFLYTKSGTPDCAPLENDVTFQGTALRVRAASRSPRKSSLGLSSARAFFTASGFVSLMRMRCTGPLYLQCSRISSMSSCPSRSQSPALTTESAFLSRVLRLLRIDGSYLACTNYIQAGIDIINFYLDSAVEAGAFFLTEGTSASLSSFAPRLFLFFALVTQSSIFLKNRLY